MLASAVNHPPGSAREPELLRAIGRVRGAVTARRARENAAIADRAARLRSVAEKIRARSIADLPSLEAEHRRLVQSVSIAPLDPRDLAWDPLGGTGVEHAEVRWTQWMATALRAGAGLVWGALCDACASATVQQSSAITPVQFWRELGEREPGHVQPERTVEGLGRPDRVIESEAHVVVVEIKRDAGWHDGDEVSPADAYREVAKRVAGHRQFALVLLTDDRDMEHPPDFVKITWAALAVALRRRIRDRRSDGPDSPTLIALMTVAAIERHRMNGRALADPPAGPAYARARFLRRAVDDLRGRLE